MLSDGWSLFIMWHRWLVLIYHVTSDGWSLFIMCHRMVGPYLEYTEPVNWHEKFFFISLLFRLNELLFRLSESKSLFRLSKLLFRFSRELLFNFYELFRYRKSKHYFVFFFWKYWFEKTGGGGNLISVYGFRRNKTYLVYDFSFQRSYWKCYIFLSFIWVILSTIRI